MNDLLEKLKTVTTDAIKFWELFRIIYNVVLGLIVTGFIIYGLSNGQEIGFVDTFA